MTGRAGKLGLASGLTVVLAILLAMPATALAVTIRTEGCSSAVTWTVRVLLHRDDGRQQLPTSVIPQVTQAFTEFARDVGQYTQCAAAVDIELLNRTDEWIQESDDFARLFNDEQRLRPSARVDVTILVRPERGSDDFVGLSDGQRYIVLPISEGFPNRILIMHEWLHILEGRYPGAPWPDRNPNEDAIHERDLWGYSSASQFQSDLMSARVDGQYGIRASDWSTASLPRTDDIGAEPGANEDPPEDQPPGGQGEGSGDGLNCKQENQALKRALKKLRAAEGKSDRKRAAAAVGKARKRRRQCQAAREQA